MLRPSHGISTIQDSDDIQLPRTTCWAHVCHCTSHQATDTLHNQLGSMFHRAQICLQATHRPSEPCKSIRQCAILEWKYL